MTYLLNLLLIFSYYFVISNNCKGDVVKRNKIFAIVVGIHLVLFRALANPYNYVDTELYAIGFDQIRCMSFREALLQVNYYTHWGLGYIFLNWTLGQIVSDSCWLFILVALLTITPVVWFYYKTSSNPFLCIVIFVLYPMMYYQGFGVLRQHLSVAYILLALYYLDTYKYSVPLSLLALSFHTSAIVFIPFFFFRRIRFRQMSLFSLIFLIVFSFLACRLSMNYILSFIPKYEEIVMSDSEGSNLIPVIWLLSLTLLLMVGRINNRINACLVQGMRDEYIMKFIIYGTIIALFSIGLNGMGRFTICFLYVIPVGISLLYKYSENRLIYRLCILFSFIVIFRQLYYALSTKAYHYSLFWENAIEM